MMLRTRVLMLMLVGLAAMAAVLGGCGGMSSTDDIINDIDERPLLLALRVQDADGNAIGGVRVFVDGRRDDWLTEWEFEPLGLGWPTGWRDWEANWSSEQWALHSPVPGERLDIAVRKVGWTEDVTVVTIEDNTFDRYFIRDTMTLYPQGSDQTAPPHEAEVVGQ